MANKVPISNENIAFERLDLTRHYLTIDCDFTVYLVLNSSGVVPAEGTDICILHTGSWQIDTWSFLTKKDFPNQAGFTAHLVWDKTLVKDGYNAPQAMESDIDTANSVSSLKGQPVNITGFSMPQGETLPVSIWRNSVEVSDVNPVPSSLVLNGSPVAPANPVPSSMQIGEQKVSPSNPVPSSMMFDGLQVSDSNPVPTYKKSDYIFCKLGSIPSPLVKRYAARVLEDAGHFEFKICPLYCSMSYPAKGDEPSGWLYWAPDYCVHYKDNGSPNATRYLNCAIPDLFVRVSKESGNIDSIIFSCNVMVLGSSTTTVSGPPQEWHLELTYFTARV